MNDDRLSAYRFDLPPGRIAQHPAERRDASRLMVLPVEGGLAHRVFADLPELLRPGDLLVRNNVRVLPARLRGRRAGGGAAEALLVRRDEEADGEVWLCMVRPANRFKPGREIAFADGQLLARVEGPGEEGMVWLRFSRQGQDFLTALDQFGQVPLPPYIERPERRPNDADVDRYQTIYARHPGAVAAPTAGLHFTLELDARLAAAGIETTEVTLNVGPGTFRPIKEEDLGRHRMHAEYYDIPAETSTRLADARRRGGRVVAVGTTTVRALESAAATGLSSGWTSLFIRPGYRFAVIDGLITNFHLPGSSLLVMISALAGRKRVLDAYEAAIADGYRFYSYGDAMLLWRPLER